MRKGWIVFLAVLFLIGCAGTVQTSAPEPTPIIVETIIVSVSETGTAQTEPIRTPAPTAVPTDVPNSEPTMTPSPEPTATQIPYTAKDGVYTIAWISDPQHYSAKFPELYEAMTLFLRDHQAEMNLQYIIHTGDLVNKTSDDAQWKVASLSQSYIDDIPNGVLAGNHDCQSPDGFEPYSKYFGEDRYKDKPWYGGSYKNNRGHYDLLTLGQTDYLFVYMSYGPDSGCIKWLNKVFQKYPDRVGFLLLHDYFENDFTRSKDGKKLFEQVVEKNPNVYVVCCGHRYGVYRQITELDDDGDGATDRTVVEMMFNYQAAGKIGGNGYLRLLQVDESAGTIHMLTYSPSEEDFNRFDDPENREEHYEIDETAEDFVIPIPWID